MLAKSRYGTEPKCTICYKNLIQVMSMWGVGLFVLITLETRMHM